MKILICDDQTLIRDSLTMLLKLEPDMQVIGAVSSGYEAVKIAVAEQPDVVLMDLKMSGMNGIDATRQIMKQCADCHILILTTFSDDTWIFDAIRAGASGYILKDSPREQLIKAVRDTAQGRNYIDSAIAGRLLKQLKDNQKQPTALFDTLTNREIDVLRILARGYTNKDIAAHLDLSEGTVRNHISIIITKLGVEDRTQVAVLAIQHGFGNRPS